MKITTALMLLGALHVSANSLSQTVTLRAKDQPIKQIFDAIYDQTQFGIIYNDSEVDPSWSVTVSAENMPLNVFLKQVLPPGFSFRIKERTIFIIQSDAIAKQGAPAKVNSQRAVEGVVVDDGGTALAGISVEARGTAVKTVTDANGRFRIEITEAVSSLWFSSVGYVSQEVAIEGVETITVHMKPSVSDLEEVVVVGYGTTLRKNLTTAISTVKPDKISKAAVANMSQMLLGRAAGLQATMSSPQPGGLVNLSIRGGGTPIFIVDGVMMPSGSLEIGTGTTDVPNSIRRGGLAGLNPSDIESIEILKDASAAIYGIDAANGVVMITTKQGTESSPTISYDGNYSFIKNYPYLTPLNGQDYMNIANLFNKENYLFTNEMQPYGTRPFDNNWIPQFSPGDIASAPTTNWLDYVLKDGSINHHNVNVTGGSELWKYYLSGNYYDHEGSVVNSGMKRYTLRSNVSAQLFPFLRLTAVANINQNNYVNSSAEGGSGGHGSGSLQSALAYPSYLPVRDAAGNTTIYKNFPSPAEMVKVSDGTKSNGYYLNFAADLDIIPDMLTGRVIYGLNKENANRNLYIPSDIYFFQMYKSRGHLGYAERQNQTMEATVTFNKDIGGLARIEAVAGIGKYVNNAQRLEIDYQQINDHIASDRIEAAEGEYFPSSARSASERRSQFVRANVDLLDRYVIAGTLRRDGTDKFFPGNKYALFPSVSLAWKLSNEAFMQPVSWIDQLKVRASYGQTGSDNLGTSLYGVFMVAAEHVKFSNNSVTYIPYLLSGPDYPNVTWQKTVMKNIGLYFTLFNSRVWGSFDLFRNDVTDLLGYDPASPLASTSTIPMNYGHYMRVGWDASINTLNIRSERGFEWKSVLNLSRFNAVWLARQPNYFYEEYRYRFNEPMNAFYFYETEGIINADRSNMPESQLSLPTDAQMPGYPIIKDKSGDNEITIDDVTMRNTLPKVHVGFGNTFAYKGFDLDVFMYGQLGQFKRNYAYSWAMVGDLYYSSPRNTNQYAFDIWNSQTNPDGKRRGIASTKAVALPGNVGYIEDYQDASFVRVRNITLGYNFSGNKLGRLAGHVKSIRVYVDCQNPFTFTKFVGVDPEAQTGGVYTGYNTISAAEYPMVRTFSIGTSIRF